MPFAAPRSSRQNAFCEICLALACQLPARFAQVLLELSRVGHMLLSLQYPRFCNYLHFAFFPSGAAVCAQHLEFLRLTVDTGPQGQFEAKFCVRSSENFPSVHLCVCLSVRGYQDYPT